MRLPLHLVGSSKKKKNPYFGTHCPRGKKSMIDDEILGIFGVFA